MDLKKDSFRSYLPSAIALFLLGWGGLYLVITQTLPFVWSRWGFFVLTLMALTGTALPIVYFLHKRFPGEPPAESNVIIRQALWVGVFGATLAWLQLGRLVTLYVILGLAGGSLPWSTLSEFVSKPTATRPKLPKKKKMTTLRNLPSVEQLLQTEIAAHLIARFGRPLTLDAIRFVLDDTRARFKSGQITCPAFGRFDPRPCRIHPHRVDKADSHPGHQRLRCDSPHEFGARPNE
jgi:hypothetical protein